MDFVTKDIKAVYHELFDEALEGTMRSKERSDRKIDNYYERKSGREAGKAVP